MSLILHLFVVIAVFASAAEAQDDIIDEGVVGTGFLCRNASYGTECTRGDCWLPESWFCDGFAHCEDESDEDATFCEQRECPAGQLKCASGQCISNEDFCHSPHPSGGCYDQSLRRRDHCDTVTCPSGKVPCSNWENCLSGYQFCNGIGNCEDNWDEDDSVCGEHECPQDTVRCDNGQCIPESLFCSLEARCFDGSLTPQEVCSSVQCPEGKTMCPGGERCISESALCDGFHDCPDQSDEDPEICTDRECPEWKFRCNNGQCLEKHAFCVRDEIGSLYGCADGSLDPSDVCEEEDELFGCVSTHIMCENGERCLDASLECDGFYDCSDHSDEHPDNPFICPIVQEGNVFHALMFASNP